MEDNDESEADPLVIGKIVERSMEAPEDLRKPGGTDLIPEEVQETSKSSREADLHQEDLVPTTRTRELEDQKNQEQVVIVFNIVEKHSEDISNKESTGTTLGISDSLIGQQGSSKKDEEQMLELQQSLTEKESEVQDLKLELQSIKDEFLRFRRQSESNAEDYQQKVEALSEQLLQMKTNRGFPHRAFLDSFPENEVGLIGVSSSFTGTSIGDESYSIDAEQSTVHESSMDELEEYHKKIYQLTQSLRSMSSKQKDLQRRLVEAEEERDHFKSVVVDLQQQVDVSSPEACSQLRALVQDLESEITRLEQENEELYLRVQSREVPISQDFNPEDRSPSELQMVSKDEELVDCSLDIMGEMANAVSENELGISLSYVQYAGLLAAIQKAIKQFEESKLSSGSSSNALQVLDRSLSTSLSISSVRVRGPEGEGQKRVDQLRAMLKEKEAGFKSMEVMLWDLEQEVKGHHKALSVQQEVQLEYLKQQLSSPERVIQLSWEMENLRRKSEDYQRELKALRDLQDQQQQELAIQWQSKQQAVAEKLSQHHSLSSYSQQLDHVIVVHEALQSEKLALEEALREAKNQTEEIKEELEEERNQPRGLLSEEDCQEILQKLKEAEEVLISSNQLLIELEDSRTDLERLQELSKEWKTEMESEKQSFLKEKEDLLEKVKIAEGLRLRAEQEKSGLQEILSLTSETTSQEIMSLRNQVQELSSTLQDKNESLQQTMNKISQQNVQIQQFQQRLKDRETELVSEKQDLKDQLQIVNSERSHLEDHVRNYKQVIAGLNKDLGSYDLRLKEASKEQEAHLNAFKMEQEKAEELEQTVHGLKTQISELESRCARLEELEETVEILSKAKQELETNLEDLRKQDRRKEQEIALLQGELHELKEKLSEGVTERLNLQEKLANSKQQLIDENASWEAEFAKLGNLEIPRDQWPQSIAVLVQHYESIIKDDCLKEREVEIDKLNLEFKESEKNLNMMMTEEKEKMQEAEEENWNLQEKVDHLQNEMKCRESALQAEITGLKGSSDNKITELMDELQEIKTLYEELELESQESIQQWKNQLEEKNQEMSEVQEKARELMQEKEKEIKRLKQPPPPRITEITPASSEEDSPPTEDLNPEQSMIQQLKNEVSQLQESLAESEHTHELRDRACQVLKDEIQECQRSKCRESVDMEYVKTVLVDAFEKGTLPKTSPMLVILARLLHFSPEEMDRIQQSALSPPVRSSSGFFSNLMR